MSHASKILTPKPSGTLRPITLLTVEDQIVYQACVNLIADELKRRTRRRYETRVFAHLYAGKSSPFFYIQWQRSYRKFAKRIHAEYEKGFEYIASFDLASFYDSIDHHVLRHFLQEIDIDEDTIGFLLECLTNWTSSTWSTGPNNIYHEHGIPQGPLASGMLSEAVLQHMDQAGEQGRKTVYLRYVDDIKILAKNEDELRRKLIKLDITAKEIGLFPQTAKINIRRISDPDEEVKSVSRPPEPAIRPAVNQKKLVLRILEISRNGKIDSKYTTRFKYLLAHAEPTHRLNNRLMKILHRRPELAPTICAYISRYKDVPKKFASEIFYYLRSLELYHSVNGALLRACLGNFPTADALTLGRFCAKRLLRPKRELLPPQPSYKEALLAWALSTNSLTYAEYEDIVSNEVDWWVKKCAIRELTSDIFGTATYSKHINDNMRDNESEVARASCSRLLEEKLKLERPYGGVELTAKQMLRAAKVVKSVGQPDSRINEILAYILKRKETSYDWKKLFGNDHRHAEHMMFFLKRNRDTNIDAFLVQLDSFCDLLISNIYARLKPGKKYPSYGNAIKDTVLVGNLPLMTACLEHLHNLRLESATAHPKTRKTGKPTRRLKHRDYHKIRKDLVAAFDELETVISP